MFLHALAGVLGGVLGHFNPLVAGILLVLGVILLRPSQGRAAARAHMAGTTRRDRRAPVLLTDEESVEPVQQRAVAGARRASSPSPSSPARRRPPRGGGGLFLLLVGALAPVS